MLACEKLVEPPFGIGQCCADRDPLASKAGSRERDEQALDGDAVTGEIAEAAVDEISTR
jgi:hypothetical protein